MLYGPSGVGKSFIALAWAYAIAHGLPWLGRAVRPGSVIYVAGEGGGGLGPRLKTLQTSAPGRDGQGTVFVLEPVQLVDESYTKGLMGGIKERNSRR